MLIKVELKKEKSQWTPREQQSPRGDFRAPWEDQLFPAERDFGRFTEALMFYVCAERCSHIENKHAGGPVRAAASIQKRRAESRKRKHPGEMKTLHAFSQARNFLL